MPATIDMRPQNIKPNARIDPSYVAPETVTAYPPPSPSLPRVGRDGARKDSAAPYRALCCYRPPLTGTVRELDQPLPVRVGAGAGVGVGVGVDVGVGVSVSVSVSVSVCVRVCVGYAATGLL